MELAFAEATAEQRRKREDSNLRYPCGYNSFRNYPIQPLWHASQATHIVIILPSKSQRSKEKSCKNQKVSFIKETF